MFLMGCVGGTLYYSILKLALSVKNVELSSYKGAGEFGFRSILDSIQTSIGVAFNDFYAYFFGHGSVENDMYLYILHLLFAIVVLVLFIYLLVREKRLTLFCCTAFVGCLIPIACNFTDVMIPNTNIYVLTAGGLTCVIPCLVLSLDGLYEKNKDSLSPVIRKCATIILPLFTIAVTYNYILMSSADAIVLSAEKNQAISLANRIYTQLQLEYGYSDEQNLLIIGNPISGNYDVQTCLYSSANMVFRWGVVWDNSYLVWEEIYNQFVGVQPNWVSEEDYESIISCQEFLDMPLYPNKGSINKIEDTWVVKIQYDAD
jgi:hypothetical protein